MKHLQTDLRLENTQSWDTWDSCSYVRDNTDSGPGGCAVCQELRLSWRRTHWCQSPIIIQQNKMLILILTSSFIHNVLSSNNQCSAPSRGQLSELVTGHMLTQLVQDPRPGPGSSPRVSCCPPSARVTRTRPASSPGSWWRPLITTGTDFPWSTLTWTGTRPVLTIFSG